MEEWKKIKDFECYEISNCGRLRKTFPNGKVMLIKPDLIRGGYFRYTLHKNKKYKRFIAHRLVAMYFIPNPNNYPQINHKDNNRTNNRVENLEWCTALYNSQYRDMQDRHTPCKKVYQYDKDYNLIRVYRSTREVSRVLGYAKSSVPLWCSHRSKPKNPYIWSYYPSDKSNESSTTIQ